MKTVKIDHFRDFTFLNNLKYSPTGKHYSVVANKASTKNSYNSTLFVNKGDGFYPLTSATGVVKQYTWLDDENIIFAETRCKETQEKISRGHEITSYYKININGGEATHAFDVPAIVESIETLGNGEFLLKVLFDNSRPNLEGKPDHEIEAILKELKKDNESYQVIDELPYWADGRGFVNKKRRRLYTFSKCAGLTPLTQALDDVISYKLSDCGTTVLYTGDKAPYEIHSTHSNLYKLNIKTGAEQKLLPQDMRIHNFETYDNKVIVTATLGDKHGINENPDFYIVDENGCNLFAKFGNSVNSSAISDSKFSGGITSKVFDGAYYFTSLSGFYSDVYKLCLSTGDITNATNSGGNLESFDISQAGIIYTGMKNLDLQEIYCLANGATTKTSNFNENALAGYTLSEPIHHVIKDENGYEIDGWVMKPVGYKAGNKYPAILNIHGGPKAAYGNLYMHEMQYWAGQGYFVMYSNPRGGDGKGNDFMDIRGMYGTVDYDNLMQFTDEMCAKYPDIDTTKLGVTGGSYGGFMTNWIVGHNTKFAAAATQRSISNWISKSNTTDIGYYFNKDQVGTDTWENLEKIWWHSPLKYAPNVKTPTLIIHADADFRCWITEAYQWFTALKLHGVETRMHIFKGEGHELSRSGKPDHRERRMHEITSWMDKYLKNC